MRQKRFACFIFLGFLVCGLEAQESKPLIQLNPFSTDGIGAEESGLIASLVRSYLADFGRLVNYAPPVQSSPARPSPSSSAARSTDTVDYTINGTIRVERDNHVFMLEIMNTKTGENYSISSAYKNTGEMALKTRSVLESAFSGGLEAEKKPAAQPERISEGLIAGTWKGEAGIEIIRLLQGGRGLAVFSSGAQMVLSYAIDNNILKVKQISPNSERFYYPLPLNAARRLSQGAEPVVWEMSLYQDGTVLGGVKISTGIRLVNGEAGELIPGGDVREIVWNKLGH